MRILELFGNDTDRLKAALSTCSFTDAENVAILQKLYTEHGYIADPHGALGFEALEQLRALEHGRRIHVLRVRRATHGIDTPEQYEQFVKRYRQRTAQTQDAS